MDKTSSEIRDEVALPAEQTELSAKRRRFVRAGLVAAPVLLTLKSQSVLAGGQHACIKTSAFSSLNAAGNQGGNVRVSSHTHSTTEFVCRSHGFWINHNHPSPYNIKANSYFRTTTGSTSDQGKVFAGFAVGSGHDLYNKTLQQVLTTGGGDEIALARHLVGTFLTAVAQGDAGVILTQEQCKQMWAARNGTWLTPHGEYWDITMMLKYFDFVY